MSFMFYNYKALNKINIGNINTKNIRNMTNLFNRCLKILYLDLTNFYTNKVVNMP